VDIDLPAAGTYQITVTGTSVIMKQSTKTPGTYQDFSIVCDYPLRTTLAKLAAPAAPAAGAEIPGPVQPPVQMPTSPPTGLDKLSTPDAGTPAVDAGLSGDPYSRWRYTAVVTVNTSSPGCAVGETVKSFPLPVLLTNKNLSFAQAQASGGDLRFCDADGAPLPYWIESWNAGERSGRVWVLVPQIAGNCRYNQIVMYWGNPDAAVQSDRGAVFGSGAGFAAFICNTAAPGGGGKPLTVAAVNTLATSLNANGSKQFCLSWRTAFGNQMAFVADSSRFVCFRNGERAGDRLDLFDKSETVDDIVVSSCIRTPSWIRLLQLCAGENQRIVEIR
jgi:hypothetical protein